MNVDQAYEYYRLLAERKQFEKWRYWIPVAKHEEFFADGEDVIERMLRAGNGNGKSEAAAFEVSRHLTGDYPSWWQGYRFPGPIRCWVGGTSGIEVRDAPQMKLFGTPGDEEALGTGFIPRDAIFGKPTAGRSAPNSIDSATIRHVSGKNSRLVFKTYEQDRRHWQGADLDLIWFDEEPPSDIYTEGRARLRGKGLSMLTATPLMGVTDLIRRFADQDQFRRMVTMGLKDATWYTPQQMATMIAGYPAHEREARVNGTPFLGEGAVFNTSIDTLMEPTIPLHKVPREWALIWGIDFGIAHPFAAVLLAWDRDNDTVHILRVIRMKDAIPMQHAHAIRQIAANVPVAWPHDGNQRDKGSGEQLAAAYKRFNLNMLETHATHPTGGYSFEAGILDLNTAMQGGQFRVNECCREWFEEYTSYYRKDGQVVKVNDDLMSATRIAYMMRRRAKVVPLGSKVRKRDTSLDTARDMDTWMEAL